MKYLVTLILLIGLSGCASLERFMPKPSTGSPNSSNIKWVTNKGDPDQKRAVIFVTGDQGGRLTLRIDAPDKQWLMFKPAGNSPCCSGTMRFRFDMDSNGVTKYQAYNRDEKGTWSLSGDYYDETERIVQNMRMASFMDVTVVNQPSRGSADSNSESFKIAGFYDYYKRALSYVKN